MSKSRDPSASPCAGRGRAVHSLHERGKLLAAARAGARALQEAHGLPAERAQVLCAPAGDRRDLVGAQQQHHARSVLDARPVSQAQACRGVLRYQRLRLLHGAQLHHAQGAARRRLGRLGPERAGIAGPGHRRDGAGRTSSSAPASITCVAASADPTAVPTEILDRLKQHLTPPQIVELACVVGFWKFYNTVHDSLHIPVESQLLQDTGYVDLDAA